MGGNIVDAQALVTQFGPWGLIAVGAVALWKKLGQVEDRYAALVERIASALEQTPTQLKELKVVAYEIRDEVKKP